MDDQTRADMAQVKTLGELYPLILNKIKDRVGASAVYLGEKIVQADDTTSIRWIASTSEQVVNQVVTESSGVSLDALVQIETSENNEAPEEPSEEEGGEPSSKGPHYPAYIHIPNVIREPRMTYYGVPALGAYLVKAMHYTQALAAENQNVEAPAPREATLVLAGHTMGQARAFSAADIATFVSWTTEFQQILEAAELRLWRQDFERSQEALLAFVTALPAKLEALSETTTTEEEEEAGTDPDPLKGLEIQLTRMTEILLEALEALEEMANVTRPAVEAVALTLAALCCALGSSAQECLDGVTKRPDWNRLRPMLCRSVLQEKIEKFNPAVSLEEAKTLLEQTTVEQVELQSPMVAFVFRWVQTAISASNAIVEAALAASASDE